MSKIKKIKNEVELLKEAIRVGMKYGESRGVLKFEQTDSIKDKVESIYRLLVRDKLIQAMPESQVTQQSMGHKLALWISRQLPTDHPLLK